MSNKRNDLISLIARLKIIKRTFNIHFAYNYRIDDILNFKAQKKEKFYNEKMI